MLHCRWGAPVSVLQEVGSEGTKGWRGSPAQTLPKNRKESPHRVSHHSGRVLFQSYSECNSPLRKILTCDLQPACLTRSYYSLRYFPSHDRPVYAGVVPYSLSFSIAGCKKNSVLFQGFFVVFQLNTVTRRTCFTTIKDLVGFVSIKSGDFFVVLKVNRHRHP